MFQVQSNITWHAEKQEKIMQNEEKYQCFKIFFKWIKGTKMNETNTKTNNNMVDLNSAL